MNQNVLRVLHLEWVMIGDALKVKLEDIEPIGEAGA